MSDWQPSASVEQLQKRAVLLGVARRFFERRNLLEVETPQLSRFAITDPALHSAAVRLTGSDERCFLQTSPEFFMKRLLVSGSGDIWQACKVFRGAEQGRWHNPEFTLLEWYRLGWDHHRLMAEVAELLGELLPHRVSGPAEGVSYRDAFQEHVEIDPFDATDETLHERVGECGIDPTSLDRDGCLDLLASHFVYPRLGKGRVTFVTDFPASQAALARLNDDGITARRFEAFVDGVELANGFHELGDPGEQRRRFEQENARRHELGLPEMPIDECLLAALEEGLPDCAGVALGFDRVVMLATGAGSIGDVVSFSFDRV